MPRINEKNIIQDWNKPIVKPIKMPIIDELSKKWYLAMEVLAKVWNTILLLKLNAVSVETTKKNEFCSETYYQTCTRLSYSCH